VAAMLLSVGRLWQWLASSGNAAVNAGQVKKQIHDLRERM